MGDDASYGVVDHKCRCFNGKGGVHAGLYVCDGANIHALHRGQSAAHHHRADRACMIHFARDHNLGIDDAPRRLVEVT